jgi:hypothetical protein
MVDDYVRVESGSVALCGSHPRHSAEIPSQASMLRTVDEYDGLAAKAEIRLTSK